VQFINKKKEYTFKFKLGVEFENQTFTNLYKHEKWDQEAEDRFGPSIDWKQQRARIAEYPHDKVPIYSFYSLTGPEERYEAKR